MLNFRELLAACSVLLLSLCGCASANDLQPFDATRVTLLQMEPLLEGEEIAVLTTTEGEIRLRFFPSEAPEAVRNFVRLVGDGFYDDKPIYAPGNYIKEDELDHVILSGSDEPDGSDGICRVNGGKAFKKEISTNLWSFTGSVSVLGNKQGKGDSRFFITGTREVPQMLLDELSDARYPKTVIQAFQEMGGLPEYALEYSVFAQVVSGQEVVDQLIAQMGNADEKPMIQSVRIEIHEE